MRYILLALLFLPAPALADATGRMPIEINNGIIYYDCAAGIYVVLDQDLNRYYPIVFHKITNITTRQAKHLIGEEVWVIGTLVPPRNGWGWGTIHVYFVGVY